MKKVILFALIVITFAGCQISSAPNNDDVKKSITYFKDESTGLCFASINSSVEGYQVTSITCVPCDSLKKIGIK